MTLRILVAAPVALLLLVLSPGQRTGDPPNHPTTPLTFAQVWRVDAVYKDRQHGVSFRYPSIWKASTSFGYWPPALTASDRAKPTAGFGYVEGGFPRTEVIGPYSRINLEGLGIVYSAVAAASGSECEAVAVSISEAGSAGSTVLLGGRSFSVHETFSAGMSQHMSGKLYATYTRGTCYLFETDIAEGPWGPGFETRLTPAQRSSIEAHLLRIVKTVKIE